MARLGEIFACVKSQLLRVQEASHGGVESVESMAALDADVWTGGALQGKGCEFGTGIGATARQDDIVPSRVVFVDETGPKTSEASVSAS